MKHTLSVLQEVFTQPKYFLLTLGLSWLFLTSIVVFLHARLIWQVISSPAVTLLDKELFLFTLYGVFGTNFSVFSVTVTFLTVLLLSMNISLLIHYLRRQRRLIGSKRGHAAGATGLIAGIFGIGCAACGSIIMSAIFASVGAGGLLLLLPFHGAEIGLLGIGLLLFSIYQLTKQVTAPMVC